jgi:DNA-binding NarL/FixJ family response regulator
MGGLAVGQNGDCDDRGFPAIGQEPGPVVTPALGRRPSGPLPPVRIAIAYRDRAVRSALRAVLEQVPGCQIVADGTDATEVAEQVRQQPSDLLLVDVRAPQIAGMTELLDAAWQKSSQAAGLSAPPGPDGQERPPGAADPAGQPGPAAQPGPGTQDWRLGGHRLTARERQVLGLIAAGLSNRQIAELLFISPKTVKNHVSNIYRHIGVSQRSQAMNAWRDLGQPDGLSFSQGLSA